MRENILHCCLAVFLFSLVGCNDYQRKPNVIFILADDVGWKDLTSYGSDFYQTPTIDSLSLNGVKFTNAYTASSVCSPTRASILTGKYPANLALTDYIPGKSFPDKKLSPPNWKKYLDTTEVSIGKIFKSNGYVTGHIGKWHLGEDTLYWPEEHGFETNIAGWSKGQPIRNKKKGTNGYFSPYGNPRLKDGLEGEYLTNRLAKEAKHFIEENKDSPFFLNFWLYSVHLPLQAESSKIVKYEKLVDSTKAQKNIVYAAMIEHLDDAVKTITSTLKQLKIEDNTIIVFTSDNGGLVGNHKRFVEKITSNYPLKSGKGDMFEGGIRVPCIIYYPKKIKPRVDDSPIISIDFLPTLLELTGITPNKNVDFHGVSLAKLLLNKQPLENRPLFWHYPHYHSEGAVPHSAIRYNDYKLIHNLETDSLQLYNLDKDVGETTNLISENTALAKELFDQLQKMKSSFNAQEPRHNNIDNKIIDIK